MAEHMAHPHGMTPDDARRRLTELRAKEKTGTLTVTEAGEITRLLVVLGESTMEEKGRHAA